MGKIKYGNKKSHGGAMAKAMVVGMEKRHAHAQTAKRKRIFSRFMKTEKGRQVAAQIEAGALPAESIEVDGNNIEVKATVNPEVAEDTSSDEGSENESKDQEEEGDERTED